jgi:hypothetical protein
MAAFVALLGVLALPLSNRPYPISRGLCQASSTVPSTTAPLADRALDVHTDTCHSHRYYARYCRELTKDDIGGQSDLDLLEVFVARSSLSNASDRAYLATAPTFDFCFLYPDDPSRGVIYYSEGEPFATESQFFAETVDIELNVVCDRAQTNASLAATFECDASPIEAFLSFRISSASWCSSPAPTPTLWDPHCRFVRREAADPRYGIDVHFDLYNAGASGARAPLWIVRCD